MHTRAISREHVPGCRDGCYTAGAPSDLEEAWWRMVAQIAPVAGRPAESPIFSLRLWHTCRVHSGALRPLLGALKERKTTTTDGQPINLTSVEPHGPDGRPHPRRSINLLGVQAECCLHIRGHPDVDYTVASSSKIYKVSLRPWDTYFKVESNVRHSTRARYVVIVTNNQHSLVL